MAEQNTEQMAPTPRVDSNATYRDGTWECVDADFARQLERELANALDVSRKWFNEATNQLLKVSKLSQELATERAAQEQAEAQLATALQLTTMASITHLQSK